MFVRTLTESCPVLTVHCSVCPVPARQLLERFYRIGSQHPPGKVVVLKDRMKRTPVVTAFKPQKICSLPGSFVDYKVKWFFLLLFFICVSVDFNFFGFLSIPETYFNTENDLMKKGWEIAVCVFA